MWTGFGYPIGPMLPHRLPHRDDVLGRHVSLNVVDRGKHKPTPGHQLVQPPQDRVSDLVWGPVREDVLGVDPAAPEDDLASELGLQRRRIHPSSADLDRIEHVDSNLDQVGDDLADRPTGVQHHLCATPAVEE